MNKGKSRSSVSSLPEPRRCAVQRGRHLASPRDRAALQKELAHSAALFRYLFENVNDAIFIHDLDGHFLEVNQVACQRLGYTRQELLRMGVRQLDSPEVAAHFDEGMQGLLQKKSVVAESCHRRKDGTCIPVEIGARVIEYKGQPAVLSVARDISERKRLEAELRERNRELAIREERDRLGRELHDGLGQVLGYVGVKSAAIDESLQHEQMDDARQGLSELNQVAQAAYRDVREAILGLRATVTADVGLESILREYLYRFQREWGIASELVVTNGTSTRFIPSAEIQILRIIQEALTNTRKHAQARHVWVRFERTADAIVVTVKDDGKGFDQRQSRREHFGLQTMRERAESIGGRLAVESAENAGTIVGLTVPRSQVRSEG